MTTGKAIALTRWTLVGKVMSLLFKKKNFFFISLLFNMLSRLVVTYLVNSAMNIGYIYLFEAVLYL